MRTSSAPIAFICHSLGGLIVKKLILIAQSDRGQDTQKRAFLERIAGVVFIATPHSGSPIAKATSLFGLPISDTVRELQSSDDRLVELSVSYRNFIADQGGRIRHRVYFETENIARQKTVDAVRSDPGLTGVRPVAIGRDHIAICKTPGKDDELYESVLAFLEGVAVSFQPPMQTSEQFSERHITKPIGRPIVVAFGALLTWLIASGIGAFGPALSALFSLLGGILFLAFSLINGRYLVILGAGAEPVTSPGRQAYDSLRAAAATENLAARLYAERLKRFLDWIDWFFGDAGMAARSLFPHAFGLKKAAPLWTAPAFDRCLFLALIYPIVTIFIIWAVSGHAGPAEMALGLKPNVGGWSRGLVTAAAAFMGFATWRFSRGEAQKWAVWRRLAPSLGGGAAAGVAAVIALAAVTGGAVLTFVFGSIGAGALAFGVAVATVVGAAGRVAGAVTIAAAVPAAFSLTYGLAGTNLSTVLWVAAATGAASVCLLLLCAIAIRHQMQGVFLIFFVPAMIMVCLWLAGLQSSLSDWPYVGPLLLFLGLLTLLNAPFDWASLGLTRALLRRGLELGGWWPYLLALVDAVLAGVIIACLALTMVVAVQAFDQLSVHGGGERAALLPIDTLVEGIGKNPAAPEYWWVYALLLSSMIPSLVNLMIGGTSLLRGVPGLPALLLRFMPEGRAVPTFDRSWLALIFTSQIFAGAFLGLGAQAFLVWGVFFHLMPSIGLDLLDMARVAASFDVPGKFFQFSGIMR